MKRGKLASLIMSLLVLVGCTTKKVEVSYLCDRTMFLNAQDAYQAGEEVVLKVELVIGYDYDLDVNGRIIYGELDTDEGVFTYTFKMPNEKTTINLVNVKSGEEVKEEGVLIASYYFAPVAIVGEGEYKEVSLYLKDGIYFVHNYTGSTIEKDSVTHSSRQVDRGIVDAIDELVKQYDLDHWKENGCDAIDGAIKEARYTNSKGEISVISTDWMPENGEEALNAINHLLNSYGVN